MPTRPDYVNERIKNATSAKVPHFFMEAKNKEKHLVEDITDSTVNKLRKIIPNKNIKFEDVAGHFDYTNLMSEENYRDTNRIVDTYRAMERLKKTIMANANDKDSARQYYYSLLKKELNSLENDDFKIADILIKELYGKKSATSKDSLWNCFGSIILNNLKNKLGDTKSCERCSVTIQIKGKNSKYCEECASDIKKEKTRARVSKLRSKK